MEVYFPQCGGKKITTAITLFFFPAFKKLILT